MLRTIFATRVVVRANVQCWTCGAQPEYTVTKTPDEVAADPHAFGRSAAAALDAVASACGGSCKLAIARMEVHARQPLDD